MAFTIENKKEVTYKVQRDDAWIEFKRIPDDEVSKLHFNNTVFVDGEPVVKLGDFIDALSVAQIKGWSGFLDEKGKKLAITKENKMKLLKAENEEIKSMFQEFKDWCIEKDAEEEAEEKN